MPLKQGFLHDFVQDHARKLELEGTAQSQQPDIVKIIVVGTTEAIDSLLDVLHKESGKYAITHIEIEPFLKDRDYRGIFRVIE